MKPFHAEITYGVKASACEGKNREPKFLLVIGIIEVIRPIFFLPI